MIKDYLEAGYPALCMLTREPGRAEETLPFEDKWRFFSWDCIQGVRCLETKKIIEEAMDPVEAVKWLGTVRNTVLLAHNLHLFTDLPEVIQSVQTGVGLWKRLGCALVMVAPLIQMRPEIEKYFHVIEFPLPDENELFALQGELGKQFNIKVNRKAARTAKGLTLFEAETAYALSLTRKGYFSAKIISEVKQQMIHKSGLMQFWEPADLRDVGGLGRFKSFITKRAKAYEPDKNLPRLKGILLVGVSGTGKSLSSKATASILGWPLIRLDIGALKNSLVGESERRMRQATQVIDAFGKAVIWVDEVEKSFSGTKAAGETDGGTTSSMLGYFLTWLAETRSPILVMATANDISKLPPELMRSGRFDATFFVDLPTKPEREEIIKIMNRKWNAKIPLSFAERLTGYTGAEIEQLAKDSLFDGLEEAYAALVPLSRTMREEISSLREWAKTRARFANTPDDLPEEQRQIRPLKP